MNEHTHHSPIGQDMTDDDVKAVIYEHMRTHAPAQVLCRYRTLGGFMALIYMHDDYACLFVDRSFLVLEVLRLFDVTEFGARRTAINIANIVNATVID